MNYKKDTIGNSSKRKFLKQVFGGSLAAMALPLLPLEALGRPTLQHLRQQLAAAPDEETYWRLVKQQFMIPEALLMVNAANLCPSPYVVTEQVVNAYQNLEKDVSFHYRATFATQRAEALQQLADFLGVHADEIGITRNTTESNNIVVNSLDLKKGDEVVIWEQNHPTNGLAWQERAKRLGFTVKTVAMPAQPTSAAELIAPFAEAITRKTRLIAFSHISNASGIALPAKALCQLANERGVLSMVDGAQSLGMVDLDLRAMGCDFYTGSTHKWLMGPLENGILYVKKEHLDRLWPLIIGAGWHQNSTTVDEKFCVLGQRNETTAAALSATLAFHTTLGKAQIEARTKALNAYLKQQLRERIPSVTFVTPLSPDLSAGVTIVNLAGQEPRALVDRLYKTHGIACAPTGGLRFSPHIYNTMADLDRIVDALATV
ncbi:Selenocysteine lyase/Cysteine desulfurase [Catalinimonas alkaloidigena]|uniref:Selenocysteine lyase/Cysteine desulfurase n=1 Tax=Catalinimonas alkaloidigena TaxID=1075417 RepID=A0A1G8YBG6_9BACT|nr:aminotransferase class V-fold PLP-dependent enzyme [Catalinimonas alkaloidigena]SDJ99400.1 Selenocysteine lyase/Cysteine desulfurase [Catalinimonas alkaloidigena]